MSMALLFLQKWSRSWLDQHPAWATGQLQATCPLPDTHREDTALYFLKKGSETKRVIQKPKIWSMKGGISYTNARNKGSGTLFRLASLWERTSETVFWLVLSQKICLCMYMCVCVCVTILTLTLKSAKQWTSKQATWLSPQHQITKFNILLI
jgi:hypothetical protein